MVRSIAAVLAGFAAMAVVVMVSTVLAMRMFLPKPERKFSPGAMPQLSGVYLVANLTASGMAAVFGGYVTARVAGSEPLAHGLALAGLMIVMSVISMRQAGGTQPRWYQFVLATVMPLLAVGGALL